MENKLNFINPYSNVHLHAAPTLGFKGRFFYHSWIVLDDWCIEVCKEEDLSHMHAKDRIILTSPDEEGYSIWVSNRDKTRWYENPVKIKKELDITSTHVISSLSEYKFKKYHIIWRNCNTFTKQILGKEYAPRYDIAFFG